MTDKSNTPAEYKDGWRTPPELFSALNAEFGFILDAAASATNALCQHFITEEQNTLETPWNSVMPNIPGYAWLNPPYSNVTPFVQKAAAENAEHFTGCVMLLNADTSVGWFREAISTAHEVRFITGGRLAFLSAETGKPVSGNNKGQMLIIWHPWPRTHCEMKTIDRDALLSFGARLMKRAA
ncbi:phage N-6-adenine-methyltransferase [Rahnella sp. PD12R]|uniref:phage N-6-adenine-methyltransferase n=1 Tax=Rahnella sp. PD12R TaxID=2855688 RepID=UPI001C458ADF|nr:phage N-6-adenine-methyltransferase [Rahnella sp. PD12R]MBV6817537.1 phage N-6-adenine-methyltransferase [Rahnella sp. PD12R]